MSRSTFTSPVSTAVNTSNDKNSDSQSNLFGLLEERLILHNEQVDKKSQPFVNQFEDTQKRRRMSHGDKAPTPSNSPALFQSVHRVAQFQSHVMASQTRNKRNLPQLVSPLHLSRNTGITTPPVTPECYQNSINGRKSVPSTTPVHQSSPASPLRRIQASNASGSSSLNNNVLLLSPQYPVRSASSHALFMDCDEEEVAVTSIMPHQLREDADLDAHSKRLRSLSCSDSSVCSQSKIMSPRLAAVPFSPQLKPVRSPKNIEPEPLEIPPSPKSPKLVSRRSSEITPHSVADGDHFLSQFEQGLELQSQNDVTMDD